MRGDAERSHILDQRHVERAFQFLIVQIAIARLDIAFGIKGRLFGIDQHRPADGVASEQCALRTFQHLNIGQVEGRDIATLFGERHIVEIGDDRGHAFADRQLAQAAQRQCRLVLAALL